MPRECGPEGCQGLESVSRVFSAGELGLVALRRPSEVRKSASGSSSCEARPLGYYRAAQGVVQVFRVAVSAVGDSPT